MGFFKLAPPMYTLAFGIGSFLASLISSAVSDGKQTWISSLVGDFLGCVHSGICKDKGNGEQSPKRQIYQILRQRSWFPETDDSPYKAQIGLPSMLGGSITESAEDQRQVRVRMYPHE